MCSTCDCDSTKIDTPSEGDATKCCRKCGSEAFIIIDRVHVECRDCYLESCNRKIRSTIGKTKLLKNNDPILIAYSGGASSAALLDLLKVSLEYEGRREQKFRPSILHIDTQSVDEANFTALKANRFKELKKLLEETHKNYPGWPLYWTTIELSAVPPYSEQNINMWYTKYDPQTDLSKEEYSHLLNNSQAFQAFHLAAKYLDLTDRQQYVQKRTENLINKVADEICQSFSNPKDVFKCLFTASSGTQLANNLLVDVILGNGETMHHTVSVCDTRPTVAIMRPMRDFSKKEIAFYLKARNLNFYVHTNAVTFADRKASIQTLTEAFLSKLYVDYPSTYRTLLRTGNKMQE